MNSADSYREGYEKGKGDTLGGRLAEITMGAFRDDPGGYFAAGYYDGAGGRKFNIRGLKQTRPQSHKSSTTSLPSPLESRWYWLCDASEFIPKETADQCLAALYAEGSQVAAMIGLSHFADHTCPRCGRRGYFRVHFLGRLRHSGPCGWEGFMKTGSYIGHQIVQIFHTGARAAAAMDDEKERDKTQKWFNNIFGYLFGAIFRAVSAVVLIPLHCVAALFQSNQTRADVMTRVITLVVIVAGVGLGIYKIQTASRPQLPVSQQFSSSQPAPNVAPPSPQPQPISSPAPTPGMVPPHPQSADSTGSAQPPQTASAPSFDCQKAHTQTELLICRDGHLAALDVEMVSAYRQALNRLQSDGQSALRRDHLAWLKNYSRTCNQSANDEDRATCVVNFLSAHAAELRNR